MSVRLSPEAALYGNERPLPALPPCVHYAGSERFIAKALELQRARGPVFDVAGDCEDGAPIGLEAEHARMIAKLIGSSANAHNRVGARIHDVRHPAWENDLEILVGEAGDRIAFLTLPKSETVGDVERALEALAKHSARKGLSRTIPLSVLIETPSAVHDAWAIAELPGIASLDFGTLDFVSAHHGAVPLSAMESPGQFDHALLRRAKAEVAAAALAHAIVPAHGVTRSLDDPDIVYADARRARDEFGFLRMWSIHPSQIDPIVRAFSPDRLEIDEAAAILIAAQAADWAPLRVAGKLHDRASYRYCWSVLQRAHATGTPLPPDGAAFFSHVDRKPS
ncbi:MAG: CoA ester lyase [Betaproteobacteria bacterium]|nr:MAG: CoA ester lyase [Betaproteobacteria bacterium]TMH69594.1 MAG: CoA ester lyase [Betaproteobacteria bacterium]